ncbi:polymorphic toxin-type HINT domain-containing protein [Dactylosporangium sp. CA-152071]|uniref:polymorphic toxin-type HINT domain-containing protein n=1 Tax=Dactylosporangium sp. CA-152071 TaxID=3239933 RepID=UPI003D8B05DF
MKLLQKLSPGASLVRKVLVVVALVALVGSTTARAVPAPDTPPLTNTSGTGAPPGMPDVAWPLWPEWSVWDGFSNYDYTNRHTSFNDWTPSSKDGAQAREDRCRVGNVLHQGGPNVRALAAQALAGTDAQRRAALAGGSAFESPLGVAAQQDWDASPPPAGFETAQQERWLSEINPISYQVQVPGFDDAFRAFIRAGDQRTYDALNADVVPRAGQAAKDRVTALVAEQGQSDQYFAAFRTFEDELSALFGGGDIVPLTDIANGMSADDARMFLQYGGFAKAAPAPGSQEFRLEVEAMKIRWANCDFNNPADPYRVLTGIVSAAQAEWQAELAGQKPQRDAIVAAEAQAWKDLWTASHAMVEAVGQAWVAERLLAYQKDMGPGWTPTAKFNSTLKLTRDTIAQQLTIAQQAATSAHNQVTAVDTAQTQAAQVAAAGNLPRGRGLAYALQSAQVTKASAAAVDATVAAINTAVQTSNATAATSEAMFQRACAEMNAVQAYYQRAAAQEAAAQAHDAALAAQAQADLAAQHAATAKTARATAEQQELAAKNAAADAHAKRLVAEAERQNAANFRAVADTERAKAAAAEATAQQQLAIANSKRDDADTSAATAAQKRLDAQAAETRAVTSRTDAVNAEQRRDALVAKAEAAEARAAATEGSEDAVEARNAATAARAAANEATTAAQHARDAADVATAAATAARAAATEADAAASRAEAAARAAKADLDAATAAAAKAHSAAADAIAASNLAAANVEEAERQATLALALAAQASANTVAARADADAARVNSSKAVGAAFASLQSAFAARDAALLVAAPADDAIALGAPYQQIDSSAGMAVLVGQSAKTLAEQQAAVAQVRADEAAEAAEAAQAAADRAEADVKLSAEAAAAAAIDAVAAAQSLQQARLSAAAAAIDAAAAAQADANAAQYKAQAVQDSAAADAAANAARSDADAALAAASAAERDAAAARLAANAAEYAAGQAQASAQQAEADATAAEQAAANAAAAAEQAESAAMLAEIEADNNAMAVAASENGPAGEAGLLVVPNITDTVTSNGDCQIPYDNVHVCDLKVDHHLTGTVIYLARTCPVTGDTTCPEAYKIDYLAAKDVNEHEQRTVRIQLQPIEEALLKSLAYGMISDFVGCARGKVTDCAWVAGTLLAPAALKLVARSVVALRVAMRTGVGIREAYVALRASEIEAAALARLEADLAEDLLARCTTAPVPHSFAADTRVVMSDGSRKRIDQVRVGDHVRTIDPNNGRPVVGVVAQVFRHRDSALADVSVRDGRGRTRVIHTTPHHPFWDDARGAWVEAQDLAARSRLRTEDGSRATVRSVRSFTGARDMYDLGIEGVHAYFVQAGSVAVLAHNAGSCWVDLTGPGVWTAINETMSARSAAYEFRMTGGVPRNIGYVLDNVKFDGYRAGVLIDAKGYGYTSFIVNGEFIEAEWYTGADDLVKQARRQLNAAQGTGSSIYWPVAEEETAIAIRNLFAREGIVGIDVVFVP